MAQRAAQLAAVDLGASSGRVIVGDVGPDRLDLHTVARFDNEPVLLPDGLHWDPVELYRQALHGLWRAVREFDGPLAGVAVDSWAVDYALLRSGRMRGVPFHYRDARTAAGVARVHALVGPDRLFARNGLQHLDFNTCFQLAAEPVEELSAAGADRMLLIPDLLGYWLTGEQVTERTNASTTGLLDPRTRQWDGELIARLGFAAELFTDLVDPGTPVGTVTAAVGERIGQPGLQLTAVGSHDTASAVVGVPMTDSDAVYISCGTWGLVGLELAAPVLTEAARAANFTNEGGVDRTTRFLTNVMGLWLLSETLRTWERHGEPVDLVDVLAAAAELDGPVTVFDVQDPRFVPPGDMVARIDAWCAEHAAEPPRTKPQIVRSIVESLAVAFTNAAGVAAHIAGCEPRTIHVVGGGSQNTLLCQRIADLSGLSVLAGPVEATAIGNLLVQARAVGAISGSLGDLRELVARTHDVRRHQPEGR